MSSASSGARRRLSVLHEQLQAYPLSTGTLVPLQSCPVSSEALEYASEPPCFFPTTLVEVPVRAVRQETRDSKVITFELPKGVALNLPVSSCILMNAPGYAEGGKDLLKPYNPISESSTKGSFDLLVKVYPDGKASRYAGSLKPGDRVSFKQVKPNVKSWRYPFGKKRITMVAGGTGITPMYQALLPLMSTSGDSTEVRLLYSNKSPEDMMLKKELDELAKRHADRLQVHYIIGENASDQSAAQKRGWSGETGWIDEEKIRRLAFPPAVGSQIWVCGPDSMYKALAGSRMNPLEPGTILPKLGYTEEMVWRS
eukprot:gnl/TRDRNA2_/TRDRNA2_128761_c0_seq2.p1 gnl/TRDRNA2_/TRDRNA2_128761_c0~~gnl/TRDRNA2_/TRDRNA2_128761_c0_seq2.p1  ORF type:complete len:331 (+),score=56.37 gnl/TRDRNA2_/TRDRNA2_128761_c0_seq2:60-995(+)